MLIQHVWNFYVNLIEIPESCILSYILYLFWDYTNFHPKKHHMIEVIEC